MIPVLALVVAILAAFFGPLVTWTIARRQIALTARETWMRQFREQVAALLTAYDRFVIHTQSHTTGDPEKERRLVEVTDAQRLPYHALRLFIAERAPEYDDFRNALDQLLTAPADIIEVRKATLVMAAEMILQKERAAITDAPAIWRELCNSLGLRSGAKCR